MTHLQLMPVAILACYCALFRCAWTQAPSRRTAPLYAGAPGALV